MARKNNKKLLFIFISMVFGLSSFFVFAEEPQTESSGAEISSASVSSSRSADPARDYLHGAVNPNAAPVSEGLFQPDLFSGSATYAYPLRLPPGTNGLAPELSLIYNSQDSKRQPGYLGKGWSLNLDYVERDIKKTPGDTSDDVFFLFFKGKRYELISRGGRYHTKVESFLYIDQLTGASNQRGSYWIVKTRDGTEYRFGFTPDSELVSNLHSYVKRWSLDRIKDTHDNKIVYSYVEDPTENDAGTVYPYRISYNNEESRIITFSLEGQDSTDRWLQYSQGNKVSYARRIQGISIHASGTFSHRYAFRFVSVGKTQRMLANITYIGKDNSSSLPATSFNYHYEDGWRQEGKYSPPRFVDAQKVTYYDRKGKKQKTTLFIDTGARVADVDGDGAAEYLSNNYCPKDFVKTINLYGNLKLYNADNGVRLADVTGDGLLDCVYSNGFFNSAETWIAPRTFGWPSDSTWKSRYSFTEMTCYNCEPWDYGGEEYHSEDSGCRIVDINADDHADIICGYSNGAQVVRVNNRKGWSSGSSWSMPAVFTDSYRDDDNNRRRGDSGLRVLDLNSDGFADLIQRSDANGKHSLWINDGSSWITVNHFGGIPLSFVDNDRKDKGVRFGDVDGNGLLDLLAENGAYLNTGSAFSFSSAWRTPLGFVDDEQNNEGARLADVNGDGVVDFLIGHVDHGNSAHLSKGTFNYLLKNVTSSLGGSVSLTYISHALGVPIPVVELVTRSNGMNGSHAVEGSTSYTFFDGKYDRDEEIFSGFGKAIQVLADTSVTYSYFHQDDARKGQLYLTEITDNSGTPYNSIAQGWNVVNDSGLYVVMLANTTTFTYDGEEENPLIIRTFHGYDAYGNSVSAFSEGNIVFLGDERYQYSTFLHNPEKWIVNTVQKRLIRDGSNTSTLQEQHFAYDGLSYGELPTRGDLTLVRSLLQGSSDPEEQYTYDGLGNVLTFRNPNGNLTRYTYDTTHTFLTEEKNTLGHVTRRSYDPSSGNLLTETNPNGFVTSYLYDSLYRKIAEIQPYDSESLPTTEFEYHVNGLAPHRVTLKQRENHGEEETLDISFFYDGNGNVIQTKKESIQEQVTEDLFYDSQGRLVQYSNPYYAALGYTSPHASVDRVHHTYDSLGRVNLTQFPDGSRFVRLYDQDVVKGVDGRGNTKDTVYDAYGAIVAVKEYVDDTPFITSYSYDAMGNLLTLTNAFNRTISYRYDSLGRKVYLSDPTLGNWRYAYDQNGNLVRQTDAAGNVVILEYDSLDRVVSKRSGGINITFVYDTTTIGTLGRSEHPNEIVTYDYDQRLRVVQEQREIRDQNFSIRYAYDALDRVLHKIMPDRSAVEYSYDDSGNVKSISNVLASVSYAPHEGVAERQYANGLTTVFNYDSMLRLNRLLTSGKQDISYGYGLSGNLAHLTDTLTGTTRKFSYDELSRLISATDPNASYAYDILGNLLNVSLSDRILIYSYNPEGVLTNVSHWNPSAQTFTLSLQEGWNLVSVPLDVDSLQSVDIKGPYAYDPVSKKYTDSPWAYGKGFWVYADDDLDLEVSGEATTMNSGVSNSLWNLVGSTMTKKDLAEAYPNDTVYGYSNRTWKSYVPQRPALLNTLSWIEPGKGYFIKKG